ncbi:MAG TPA: class I SAM-dependent methyltransferase [Steroidobacteraceae bacterium]|jgi:Methyltransferase domain|nr:class I SAM-dependent methyltransferase [Steroidobacteraceae bacterium]
MNVTAKRLREYYRANGLASAVARALKFAVGVSGGGRYRRFVAGLHGRAPGAVFSEIYAKGLWKCGKSHSGPGSELAYTENLRFFLPVLFERFGIRTIVDAACGDFNWMRFVPLTKEMSYVGLDIVPEVIAQNQRRHTDNRRRFAVANIVTDPLPAADVVMCRDCLFHLGNREVARLLRNFVASNSRYFLTSTHVNDGGFVNTDINTGHFRLLDLFSAPFCLPKDVHFVIDDYVPPFPPRTMCLWDREQIAAAVQKPTKT